ncbi:MAG: pirin family protein [Pseudomonadota bacterium]
MTDIAEIIPAVRTLEGAGFEVRRPFPTRALDAVGPFILFDHLGPATLEPGKALGAPVHPHAGLETLSLMFEGGGRHMDSLGNVSITGPGDIQWMRAGKGIIHDEGPTEEMVSEGGRIHGVQLWLNMPGDHKSDDPDYRQIRAADIPQIQSEGATVRLIAGTLHDHSGPLFTHSNPFLVHVRLSAGATISIPLETTHAYGAYGLTGDIGVGPAATRVGEGDLARLGNGLTSFTGVAIDSNAEFLLLGGPVIQDTLVRYGPFVANSEAHMNQIIRAYQAGHFGAIPGHTTQTR